MFMDPILSKLSQTAFTNTLPTGGGASATTGTSGSSFQQMLNLQSAQGEGDMSNAKLMSMVDDMSGGGGASGSNLNAVDASSVHVDVAKASEVDRTPKAGQFFEVLQDINKDQIQFDNLKEMVSSGRTFKPQELLAMQVGVQHLSLELELFSKGLEQVNRTIQTPINMQIG
jgi:hypothetical protein